MRLNHFANRVSVEHFETVVSLFKDMLGCIELHRSEQSIWLRQAGSNVDIQFSQSHCTNRDEDKRGSQISFIVDDPRAALEPLSTYCQQRGLRVVIGSWSDKEFFLDLPDAFVDFVIEAMTPDLAEYDV